MSRITRADAEIDAKIEREERKRKEAELRAQGIEPPKPADREPSTLIDKIIMAIGGVLIVGCFFGLYFLMMHLFS